MSVEVVATRRAQQQITALDQTHAQAFAAFLDDLSLSGCAALAYRLTGPVPLSRLCVKHLRAALRVVVAFESPQRACVLLVGPHDAADRFRRAASSSSACCLPQEPHLLVEGST